MDITANVLRAGMLAAFGIVTAIVFGIL